MTKSESNIIEQKEIVLNVLNPYNSSKYFRFKFRKTYWNKFNRSRKNQINPEYQINLIIFSNTTQFISLLKFYN